MKNWFDDFSDLDKIRDRAESLWESGVRETKRQTSLAGIRLRLASLQKRKNDALTELGARVWQLHQAGTLDPAALAELFAPVEAIAAEIRDAEDDFRQVREADTSAEIDAATADDAAPSADPGEPVDPPRQIE